VFFNRCASYRGEGFRKRAGTALVAAMSGRFIIVKNIKILDAYRGRYKILLAAIAGIVIAKLYLTNAKLCVGAILSGFCFFILMRYPVLGVMGIMAGTTLLDYHQLLPLSKISSVGIPDIILFTLLGAAIFRTWFMGIRAVRTPLDVPVILFVGIGVVSLFAGALGDRYPFFAGLKDFKPMLYYLLAILAANTIKDRKELKVVIYGCLLIGIIAVGRVIIEGWVNPPATLGDTEEIFYRYRAVAEGSMLPYWALIVFISMLMLSKFRVLIMIGASVILLWLVLSFSRHLWIAFSVSVLLVVLFNLRRIPKRIVVVTVCFMIFVSLVAIAGAFGVEPIANYVKLVALRSRSLTFEGRVANWDYRVMENQYSVPVIVKHPLLGIGFAVPYRPQIFESDDNLQAYLHNGYLWILVKLGFAGLIPFCWLSFVFVRRGIAFGKYVDDAFLGAIVVGSVCSFLGIAVGNIAAAHFMENWEVSMFGLSMGINEVIYRLEGVETIRFNRPTMESKTLHRERI